MLIPSKEFLKFSPVGKASSPDPDVLLQSQILNLVMDSLLLPVMWPLGLIGFDTSDVVRCALH